MKKTIIAVLSVVLLLIAIPVVFKLAEWIARLAIVAAVLGVVAMIVKRRFFKRKADPVCPSL